METDEMIYTYSEQIDRVNDLSKSVRDSKDAFTRDRDFIKGNVSKLSGIFHCSSPIVDTFINNFDCDRCMADTLCDAKYITALISCDNKVNTLNDAISRAHAVAN